MKEKTREKWQKAAAEFLEPGEQVQAAARGVRAKFWQLALIYGWLVIAIQGRYRTYLVTDRNVYVCKAGAMTKYAIAEVLDKWPLGAVEVKFAGGYLTVDGDHETFLGRWGPAKRSGEEAAEAASRRPAAQRATDAPGVAG